MPPKPLQTTCCIVGGGPAGMMLGFLLARSGIGVTVLEKHKDFNRDFRGDTIHPATTEVMQELGLLDAFLQVPHQKIETFSASIGNETFPLADFTHLPTHVKYIVLMPQWDFLDFLAAEARKLPSFHLLMEHEVTGLLHEGGRVVGVTANSGAGEVEVRAPLTVGCDGRHAVSRGAAHFEVIEDGVPVDILWFRISRRPDDPENGLGYFNHGSGMVLIDRNDYWQAGFVILKGSLPQLQQQGLDAFRARLGALVPFLAAGTPSRLDEVKDFSQLKLLTIQINHLRRWHAPGILCIGDAAHAMSALGGVGVNLAVQDAVATANILSGPLSLATMDRPVPVATLAQVQAHRHWAVRLTQWLQQRGHNLIQSVLRETGPMHAPRLIRFLSAQPRFRRFMGRAIGMGALPEHIKPH